MYVCMYVCMCWVGCGGMIGLYRRRHKLEEEEGDGCGGGTYFTLFLLITGADGWLCNACMYVCISMSVCRYDILGYDQPVSAYMHACMYVCMYACMHVCMYACMHVCMYACMYVCMYVHGVIAIHSVYFISTTIIIMKALSTCVVWSFLIAPHKPFSFIHIYITNTHAHTHTYVGENSSYT